LNVLHGEQCIMNTFSRPAGFERKTFTQELQRRLSGARSLFKDLND